MGAFWDRLGSYLTRGYVLRALLLLVCGVLVVSVAWVLELSAGGDSLSAASLWRLHGTQPVLWIVDALPIIGVCIYLLMSRQARVQGRSMAAQLEEQRQLIARNARFAKALGEGHYDVDYGQTQEVDTLGAALLRMRDNLWETAKRDNEESWITRCKDEVGYVLRLHNNLQVLGYEVLKKLVGLIDAVQGSLFLYDADEKMLRGVAGYAYAREKYNQLSYKLGEGLVGECAYERGTIYRTEIPAGYTTISSGLLGDQKPQSLLLVPLVTNESLQGVVEFASIRPAFSARERRFLEEVGEIVARTLFNLRISAKTETLLKESQQMTRELRENEEQLRQSAEEMQVTHEELEKSNEQLEAKIAEAENARKRLHSLLENANEVIAIYNQQQQITYISPSVTKILGYTPQEMIDGKDRERLTQEGVDLLQQMFEGLIREPHLPRTAQYIFLKRDGEKVWVEVVGRNLLDDNAICGIILNMRDITERLRAEKEERMRSKMQALSENSLDLIIRLSREGQFYYANPMVGRYLGVSSAALMGQQLGEVQMPTVLREAFVAALGEIDERREKTWEREVTVEVGGEKAILRLQAIPEYDGGVLETVLLVGHDITEDKRIENEIQDKSRKITESINYAQRIQKSILPDIKLIQQFFPRSFMFYHPRDVVSGDFPWFFEKGDSLYIAAVDCTGHGVPGALLSFIGYFTLNNVADHDSSYSAGRMLDLLHAGVRKMLRQDRAGADAQDGMDIALCKVTPREMRLEFAGAHRPLYLCRGGEITEFKGDRRPIGGIPNPRHPEGAFTNHVIELVEGDRVFFFSDGLPDQLGGESGLHKFSPQRIRELISSNGALSMPKLGQLFSEEFTKHMGGAKQIDDVLLIGIEF